MGKQAASGLHSKFPQAVEDEQRLLFDAPLRVRRADLSQQGCTVQQQNFCSRLNSMHVVVLLGTIFLVGVDFD